MSERQDIEFDSGGETCRAWLYPGDGDEFRNDDGCPCIVMAHGFAGTRDAGLEPYAEKFAAAGLTALVFDYRHFGASDGEPRQLLSVGKQLEDWAAAIAHARELPDVDGARIALWGTSFSGGLVVSAAVTDGQVAAITAQGPMLDGFDALMNILGYAGIAKGMRLTWAGLLDLSRAAIGQSPYRLPAVDRPDGLAAMTSTDAYDGYTAITPADWSNEYCARLNLTLGTYRPARALANLPCSALIQACDKDSVAPAAATIKAASKCPDRVTLKRYDIGHFDVYVGDDFVRASNDQLDFFRHHLAT